MRPPRGTSSLSRKEATFFDLIFTKSPVGIALIDRRFRYVRINEILAAMNGRTVAEHLNRPIAEVVPHLASSLIPVLQSVLDSGQPTIIELTGETVAEPGTIRDWLIYTYPARDARNRIRGIGAITIEVTQKKKREKQIQDELVEQRRMAECQLIHAYESMDDGFWLLDRDFRLLFINAASERLLRRPRSQMLGRTIWDEFPGWIGSSFYNQCLRAAREQRRSKFETYYPVLKAWFEVRTFPADQSMLLFFTDITARKRQENIAQTLQQSLLTPVPVNAFPGLVISTQYVTACNEAEIGGDFFDAFPLDGDRVALVVGDVLGHGRAAARYLAQLKFAFRAYLQEAGVASPKEALVRINRYIFRNADELAGTPPRSRLLASLSVAVIDLKSGETTIAVAGAESPMILRGGTRQPEWPTATGPLLGLEREPEFETTTGELRDGDCILLCSDGLTTARDPDGGSACFGCDGIATIVRSSARQADASPDTIAAATMAAARSFAGGTFRDDVCILVARKTNDCSI